MSSQSSYFKNTGLTVKIKGLTKSYRTVAEEIHALNGVDFQLEPGQAAAIMGPSGCGKTTLLNLLAAWTGPRKAPFTSTDRTSPRWASASWKNTVS